MPFKAKKPCRHFGCGQLTEGGYCATHRPAYQKKAKARFLIRRKEYDANRPSFRERGYSAVWDKQAKNYLRRNPLCRICNRVKITKQAKQVDHIIPHKGDASLFWDQDNWQGLCDRCHLRKTKREANETKTYSAPQS